MYNPIGEKVVLHSNAAPQHPSEEEDRIVVATIVETKEVPMEYGPGKELGWRAEDKNGKSYFSAWERFPDASYSPRWLWFSGKEFWYDITQGIYEFIPFRPKFMDDPEVSEVIYFCEKHGMISHKKNKKHMQDMLRFNLAEDNFCWNCMMGHPVPQQTGDTWKGWR